MLQSRWTMLGAIFVARAGMGFQYQTVASIAASLRHELGETNVGVTVVHPGGIRTSIALSARIPVGVNSTELQEQMQKFNAFLTTEPADAARTILDGVAKGSPRVLIGADARRGDLLQRLMPGTYWKIMKRGVERAMR